MSASIPGNLPIFPIHPPAIEMRVNPGNLAYVLLQQVSHDGDASRAGSHDDSSTSLRIHADWRNQRTKKSQRQQE